MPVTVPVVASKLSWLAYTPASNSLECVPLILLPLAVAVAQARHRDPGNRDGDRDRDL